LGDLFLTSSEARAEGLREREAGKKEISKKTTEEGKIRLPKARATTTGEPGKSRIIL